MWILVKTPSLYSLNWTSHKPTVIFWFTLSGSYFKSSQLMVNDMSTEIIILSTVELLDSGALSLVLFFGSQFMSSISTTSWHMSMTLSLGISPTTHYGMHHIRSFFLWNRHISYNYRISLASLTNVPNSFSAHGSQLLVSMSTWTPWQSLCWLKLTPTL